MATFNKGPKNRATSKGRPSNDGRPRGGYGSHGAPMDGMRMTARKGKPSGSPSVPANKPKGGFGTRSGPSKQKMSKPKVTAGQYASDGVAAPKTGIPKKSKLYNMPKGNFTGGM